MPAPRRQVTSKNLSNETDKIDSVRKVKRFSVRTDAEMHARAQAVAKYAYGDNLSEFLADAIRRRLEEVESEQHAILNSRLHLTNKELKVIAAEVENPREPNQALVDLMTKNHLNESGYKDKLTKLLNDRNSKA
ncbi:hypothetical protein PsalN5692_02840 [Piscirickettsia salmonis]|uniref:type II toxin -antitoxin system TacA 1-like antitoxin n=1 Tax=Piscirickettsia salmonis TaxID=1238 RepID=UPI0018ACE642|nr:DUF1778 domain-containing protein [Piscirickettsia salmonis]QGP51359.1 hypothetical protein PsalN5692_02840 [Piscirickettsia salmonis]